jgi:hypothetical protein
VYCIRTPGSLSQRRRGNGSPRVTGVKPCRLLHMVHDAPPMVGLVMQCASVSPVHVI